MYEYYVLLLWPSPTIEPEHPPVLQQRGLGVLAEQGRALAQTAHSCQGFILSFFNRLHWLQSALIWAR